MTTEGLETQPAMPEGGQGDVEEERKKLVKELGEQGDLEILPSDGDN